MTVNVSPTLRITINQEAVEYNYNYLKQKSGQAECGAAVKANAYGCGIENVVPVLAKNGCKSFFVADALEGKLVRKLVPNADIYLLNGFHEANTDIIASEKLYPVICSKEQLDLWLAQNLSNPYALQVDTGMNRLGLRPEDAASAISEINQKPTLVLSHFANADDTKDQKNNDQLAKFQKFLQQVPNIKSSMANSAATVSNPDYQFNLTRPGIAIYGGKPLIDQANPMKPVLKLEAQIIDIKQISKGETVSYGGRFEAPKDMKIAVCGLGYADGLPRSASGHGVKYRTLVPNGFRAYADGQYLNSLGRITMDLTIFDCTEASKKGLKTGDWIEIVGDHISVDELAEVAGTVSYEILTGFGRHRHLPS